MDEAGNIKIADFGLAAIASPFSGSLTTQVPALGAPAHPLQRGMHLLSFAQLFCRVGLARKLSWESVVASGAATSTLSLSGSFFNSMKNAFSHQ